MSSNLPPVLQEIAYEREAQAYLRSLPLEHYMEGIPQATQRKITLESLDLLHLHRPEVRVFSELLVQYPRRGRRKLGQVVPDNMVVLTTDSIRAKLSYNVPLEPVGPYWVLEYVSPSNPRKDYEDSFKKYERELRVPYYLLFYPDSGDLKLYRHSRQKNGMVKSNKRGRYPIAKLDLEVGLLDGWVRFYYQEELLLLPADLQRSLDETHRQLESARQQVDEEKQRADSLSQRLAAAEQELAELRSRLKPSS
jgi:Uma2 family endonuclease